MNTPMIDAADREELLAVFFDEAEEMLATFEELLLRLEHDPTDTPLLHEIFRAAHTLKGNAACLQFDELTAMAHVAEEQLDRLRTGELVATPEVITELLQFADRFRAAARPEAVPHQLQQQHSKSLRVGIDKLDRMLDLSGEIAIARGNVRQLAINGDDNERVLDGLRELDRLSFDLQELIMSARLVPLGPALQPFHRIVRDLAVSNGKRVVLVLETGDVEVDTTVVEHLKDPITHMIRNAVDHGIAESGTVRITAAHEAGGIALRFSDDGAGLDERAIARRARELGLDPERLTRPELLGLIFEPGFSTAREVTEVSGRGVGMDVVRRNIETLRGTIGVSSEPGVGTTFSIRLPLTLAVIDGFGVSVGDETFVIPMESIVECTEMPRDGDDESCGVLNVRGEPLPYLRLRHLFALGESRPARENVVVVQHDGGRAGVVVDELLGGSPTVMKPLGGYLRSIPAITGSSILGNGRVALVLDAHEVVRRAAEADAANQ